MDISFIKERTVCAMRRQGSHSVLALPIAHPRWIRFPDFQSEQRRSASLFIMASLNNPVSSGRLSPNSQREWIEEQFDSSDIISAKKDKNGFKWEVVAEFSAGMDRRTI
ncbi:hypothetical protein M513_13371 [Trichuris suis]|uniref:Uncharacterized protein n=1 Tax=Trichuris suis TaxID=68888 RepID=A0A085LLB9_9BILA|nr:hypothetical protein M513_13371 [Trichuris suis]